MGTPQFSWRATAVPAVLAGPQVGFPQRLQTAGRRRRLPRRVLGDNERNDDQMQRCAALVRHGEKRFLRLQPAGRRRRLPPRRPGLNRPAPPAHEPARRRRRLPPRRPGLNRPAPPACSRASWEETAPPPSTPRRRRRCRDAPHSCAMTRGPFSWPHRFPQRVFQPNGRHEPTPPRRPAPCNC